MPTKLAREDSRRPGRPPRKGPPPNRRLFRRLPDALAASYRQLLHVVLVRYLVAWVRYLYLATFRRRLRFRDPSGPVVTNTIAHNRVGMVDLSVARSETLIRPLSVIDRVARRIGELEVLCVGPRTEGELLNLWAYGFRWRNVRGLDLISYSPRIDLGDMHHMPYVEDSWDVILIGWVLSYSNDRRKACREVVRVARDGAVVAVGVEHNPLTDEEITEATGLDFGTSARITSVDQILEWFGPAVDVVYVRHDIDPRWRDRLGAIYVIFSVRKRGMPPLEEASASRPSGTSA